MSMSVNYPVHLSNLLNPKAAPFLLAFKETPTKQTVTDALLDAADATDFVGFDVAANTLAAAEIVAASLGHPCMDFPNELDVIIRESRLDLKGCSILALDAVVSSINSVCAQEVLNRTSEFNVWEIAQKNLLNRLV